MQKEFFEGYCLLMLLLFEPKANTNSCFGPSMPNLLKMLNFGILLHAFLIFPVSLKIQRALFKNAKLLSWQKSPV